MQQYFAIAVINALELCTLLESVADKKDFEISVRDVILKGLLPLKWNAVHLKPRLLPNLKSLFILYRLEV